MSCFIDNEDMVDILLFFYWALASGLKIAVEFKGLYEKLSFQHESKFPVLVFAFIFSFCRELVWNLILYLRSVVNTINKSNNTMNTANKM